MSKHTKGLWKVMTHSSGGVEDQYWIAGEHPPRIAVLNFDESSKEEQKANACLIAGAPEMLMALKEAQELIQKLTKRVDIFGGQEYRAFAIERAIMKAEGNI